MKSLLLKLSLLHVILLFSITSPCNLMAGEKERPLIADSDIDLTLPDQYFTTTKLTKRGMRTYRVYTLETQKRRDLRKQRGLPKASSIQEEVFPESTQKQRNDACIIA